MQQNVDQNWQSWQNVFHKLLLLCAMGSLVSCSSTIPIFKANTPIELKEYSIYEYNSFLPREYREVVDSTLLSKDYLDSKLAVHFPDSLPDTALYNTQAPIFDPIATDSGIVLCERDMAMYIKDRENVKYLKTEITARKNIYQAIIQGALDAEQLYRGTIIESNKYNMVVFKAYKKEKKNKQTWRNISLFVLAFGGGFILNQYIMHRD